MKTSISNEENGASNEYPQHMFLRRNKKNINTFGLNEKVNKQCLLDTRLHNDDQ